MLRSCKLNVVTAIFMVVSISLMTCMARANDDMAVEAMKPRHCYFCEGVNCYRTSMTEVTSNCTDLLDICVTVFDEFAVVAKGCYLDMPEQHRNKCDARNNPECLKCFGDRCNNLGRADFKCIQCKSDQNSKCVSDTASISAEQCSSPTAPNSYCYVKQNAGKLERGCLTHVKEQRDCMLNPACSMCLSQDGEACNAYQLRADDIESQGVTLAISLSAMLALLVNVFLR